MPIFKTEPKLIRLALRLFHIFFKYLLRAFIVKVLEKKEDCGQEVKAATEDKMVGWHR